MIINISIISVNINILRTNSTQTTSTSNISNISILNNIKLRYWAKYFHKPETHISILKNSTTQGSE